MFRIQYFLGGDLKFLAVSYGIESASCDHACIWCKCPKADRHDMTKERSIFDVEKGHRGYFIKVKIREEECTKAQLRNSTNV